LARLLLPPAGVRHWLIDTGYSGDAIVGLDEFTAVAGGTVSEIIRLEALGETLVAAGAAPAEFPDAFRAALAERDDRVVGTKTIVAYRCGFDQDWAAPSDDEVVAEVQRWQREWAGNGTPRMVSPVMSSFAVHAAAAARLPVQFHVGFGDRDLDLNRVDPLLLLPLLRQPQITRVPILLLHCYPFHRNAGYLAQAFENVYFDVGLAINYLGSASVGIIGEALELAPFAKQLYSSDAFGPPELHLLGSVLWRRGMATVLTRLVDTGDWSDADAARVVRMIGSENAVRAYRL
jgi:predicted TIM-barrel fold metal-dependent hydrolase